MRPWYPLLHLPEPCKVYHALFQPSQPVSVTRVARDSSGLEPDFLLRPCCFLAGDATEPAAAVGRAKVTTAPELKRQVCLLLLSHVSMVWRCSGCTRVRQAPLFGPLCSLVVLKLVNWLVHCRQESYSWMTRRGWVCALCNQSGTSDSQVVLRIVGPTVIT